MEENVINKNKKIIKTLIIIIILLSIALIGTYAYWFTTNTQTNSNIVTSSCLKLSFNGENDINITDGYPMTDKEGKGQTPYTFTLTNECVEQTAYTINLETVSKGSKILKDEYIKANLQQDGKDLFLNKLTEEHVNEEKIIKDASKAYKLYSGTIEPKGSEGATQTFDLRLWMDEGVTLEQTDAMNATYEGKITIGSRLGSNEGSSSGGSTISSDYNALADLIDKKEGQLVYDLTNDNNLRFVGADPDNYVNFNNDESTWRGYGSSSSNYYKYFNSSEECNSDANYHYNCEQVPAWRIIGVMNNIEDENGNMGSHLKLIRSSIGEYSWDSSETNVNEGSGVNEWSTSAIEKVLNENYYNKKVGGTCYDNAKNKVKDCPEWENIGLNNEARTMISKVKWNTGTIPFDYSDNSIMDFITPFYMYNVERSMYNGKICEKDTSYCSDEIERTTIWPGYVGLMYPSDFGFATSGGNEANRLICLKISMSPTGSNPHWGSTGTYGYCLDNTWLKASHGSGKNISTLTSVPTKRFAYFLFSVASNSIAQSASTVSNEIYPVVYLNSNVKIESNDASDYGSKTNPYKLTT